MSDLYNLENIKQDLENDIKRTEGMIKAWKAVTFPTKKDGKPFKILSKNFDGATYGMSRYATDDTEKEISVSGWFANGYESDYIYCHKYMNDLTESQKLKTENIWKTKWNDDVYLLDLDDIKEAIKDRINQLENNLKSYKHQLEHAEEVYTAFYDSYKKALKQLSEISDAKEEDTNLHSTLYYNVIDTVTHRVF